jgi:hypothetical protein
MRNEQRFYALKAAEEDNTNDGELIKTSQYRVYKKKRACLILDYKYESTTL